MKKGQPLPRSSSGSTELHSVSPELSSMPAVAAEAAVGQQVPQSRYTRPSSADLGRRIKRKTARIDWKSMVKIAQGAQGTIYRAEVIDPEPGTSPVRIHRRKVALKLLHARPKGTRDPFGPHATLTQSLESTAQHHITHLIATVKHKRQIYAVMPFFDKFLIDLLPFFHQVKALDLPAYSFLVISVMLDLLVALDYMQKNGVAHRDIKPENIAWYEAIGRFCLADMDSIEKLKQAVEFHGTLGFSHPAAYLGQEAHPLPSDDVFALGLVLQCLLIPEKLRDIYAKVKAAPEELAYIYAQIQAYQAALSTFPPPGETVNSPLMPRPPASSTGPENSNQQIVNNISAIADRMTALNMERIPSVSELQIAFTELQETLLKNDPTLSTRVDQIKIKMACEEPSLDSSSDEDQSSASSPFSPFSPASPASPASPTYPCRGQTPPPSQAVQNRGALTFFAPSPIQQRMAQIDPRQRCKTP